MTGVLVLVGGGELSEEAPVEAEVAAAASAAGGPVLVLPTGAAFEHPQRLLDAAAARFAALGAEIEPGAVLARADALHPSNVAAVERAAAVYLCGTSPMHVRSVLKDTPVWDALLHRWQSGAVVAGAGAGAMVLADPMVDPRGGALTLGLGLVEQVAVIPDHGAWSEERRKRTLDAASSSGVLVVGIDRGSALVRGADGTWRAVGDGVAVWRGKDPVTLDALP